MAIPTNLATAGTAACSVLTNGLSLDDAWNAATDINANVVTSLGPAITFNADVMSVGLTGLQSLVKYAPNYVSPGPILTAVEEGLVPAAQFTGALGGAGAISTLLGKWYNGWQNNNPYIATNQDYLNITGALIVAGATVTGAPALLALLGGSVIYAAAYGVKSFTQANFNDDMNFIASVYHAVVNTFTGSLAYVEINNFNTSLNNSMQAVLAGGMMVPTATQGVITGYSLQVPVSIVNNADGSTTYTFQQKVTTGINSYYTQTSTYVQAPANVQASNSLATPLTITGVNMQGTWTFQSGSAVGVNDVLTMYTDGSYSYGCNNPSTGIKYSAVEVNGNNETVLNASNSLTLITDNGNNLTAWGGVINMTTPGATVNMDSGGEVIASSGATVNIGFGTDATVRGGNAAAPVEVNFTSAGAMVTQAGGSDLIFTGTQNYYVVPGNMLNEISERGKGNTATVPAGTNVIMDKGSTVTLDGQFIDNTSKYDMQIEENGSGTYSFIGYIYPPPGSGGGGSSSSSSSGYAGKHSAVTSAVGSHLSAVVQNDLKNGDFAAAAIAEAQYNAFEQSLTSPEQPGATAVVLNGAKWNQPVITWSLADSPSTQSVPFSSYMSSGYAATVQEAFNTWAASMPGVTFEEVSDSAQSDIRIGFGDLNSPTTCLIGNTTPLSSNGQMLPDSIICIEDPTQDPLIKGTDGQLMYAGTDATLLQVLTHEIGHTLGLADNADPNSIMYYALTSNNRTLDSTDLAGISMLYGTGSTASTSSSINVNQLIQAMAAFDTNSGGADTSSVQPALLAKNNITLAPPVSPH